MQHASPGDSVTIVYEGLLANGDIFESSKDTGPLRFRLGTGSVLPAFEIAVLGMAPEEKKTITVPAAEAYGEQRPELVMILDRGTFAGRTIAPGMVLAMKMERDGQEHNVPATVLSVDEAGVTVDFNHPLAGQDLTYQITLLAIERAPAGLAPAGGCGCGDGNGNGSGCAPGRGCGCA